MRTGLHEKRNNHDLFGMLLNTPRKDFSQERRGVLQVGFFNDVISAPLPDLGDDTPDRRSGTLRPAPMKQNDDRSLHLRSKYIADCCIYHSP
jgi:hypothetical protein